MVDYLIRVELHGPAADYDLLHAAMAKGGASRTIPGSQSTNWMLPTGDYLVSGEKGGAASLRDAVRAAAASAKSDPEAWVLVVEISDAAWYSKLKE